jgi:glycosyltransferase involved in cell wall biosynthesis
MAGAELAVVMPVYDEAASLPGVVTHWARALDALGIDWLLHAYDDGSRDDSRAVLEALARREPRLRVHAHANRGHGPTLLRGYRENAGAAWIFQVDSDDEMGPGDFAALWERRADHDLLLAERVRSAQPLARRGVSAASRVLVRLLYGRAVRDVNAPYRLMRSDAFRPLFAALPDDTFAPNVILSGLAAALRLRVLNRPVPQRPRRAGQVSIRRWKLLRVALRSARQTVRARRLVARLHRRDAPEAAESAA